MKKSLLERLNKQGDFEVLSVSNGHSIFIDFTPARSFLYEWVNWIFYSLAFVISVVPHIPYQRIMKEICERKVDQKEAVQLSKIQHGEIRITSGELNLSELINQQLEKKLTQVKNASLMEDLGIHLDQEGVSREAIKMENAKRKVEVFKPEEKEKEENTPKL